MSPTKDTQSMEVIVYDSSHYLSNVEQKALEAKGIVKVYRTVNETNKAIETAAGITPPKLDQEPENITPLPNNSHQTALIIIGSSKAAHIPPRSSESIAEKAHHLGIRTMVISAAPHISESKKITQALGEEHMHFVKEFSVTKDIDTAIEKIKKMPLIRPTPMTNAAGESSVIAPAHRSV